MKRVVTKLSYTSTRGTKEEDVNTEDNFTNSRGVKFTQSEDEG